MGAVEVSYTRASDGTRLAWAQTGSGPTVVLVPNVPVTHVSYMPRVLDEWFATLSRHCHLVWYDTRGSGLSEREGVEYSLANMVSDLEAVLVASGADAYTLCSLGHGSPIALSYAAECDQRMSRLAVFDGWARGTDVLSSKESVAAAALLEGDWSIYRKVVTALSDADASSEARREREAFLKACVSKEANAAAERAFNTFDVTPLLERLSVSTLVVHSERSAWRPRDAAERIAAAVPAARFVLLDEPTYSRAGAEVLLAYLGLDAPAPRGLAAAGTDTESAFRTMLFTDLEGHTSMMSRLGDAKGRDVLSEHERITRACLKEHGGAEIKTMGDGFMASFGSVQRALECAIALQHGLADLPLRIRVGINAGEPIAEDDDLFGVSVIIAARIAAGATGGQVLVADVVRQLVVGKGFLFSDTGEHALKGLEEPVRIWELRW